MPSARKTGVGGTVDACNFIRRVAFPSTTVVVSIFATIAIASAPASFPDPHGDVLDEFVEKTLGGSADCSVHNDHVSDPFSISILRVKPNSDSSWCTGRLRPSPLGSRRLSHNQKGRD